MTDFYKYQGTGNDFIIINNLAGELSVEPDKVALLCNRHFGIGADGLILVNKSETADYYMDFYNSDGSKAEMCGNGIRCLAAFAQDHLGFKEKEVFIDTLAGVKELMIKDEFFTVKMGRPVFKASKIPVDLGLDEIVDYPVEVSGIELKITCLSMGNPHTVIFTDEHIFNEAGAYGPVIENMKEFPNKTNVEFVIMTDGRAEVVVWERGAGLTLACGTGACAVLAAVEKTGRLEGSQELIVDLPGGGLKTEFDDSGSILLTGPAEFVYKGSLEI